MHKKPEIYHTKVADMKTAKTPFPEGATSTSL